MTRGRRCKANSQRETIKVVRRGKMKKLLKTRGIKKNVKKSRVVGDHYKKWSSPVTLEKFLPSWFHTMISHCDTKASCCNIEKEEIIGE